MKLEALDHPKTLDLASRLNVEIPTAIGYLELLWAFTGRKAPQGDIGKWPDGAIARACYWNADPTVFVTALVTAGFLDAHPQYRLVVHDWQDHAPRWVLAKLARAKRKLIDCSRKYRSDSSGDYLTNQPALRADYSGHYSGDSVSEVKGSEVKGREGKGIRTSAARTPPPEFAELRAIYPKRAGADPTRRALSAINARLSEGHTWQEILDGARRYADYCRATQSVGTQYVKQLASFCGPEKFFLQPWNLPRTKAEAQQDANIAAAREWLARSEEHPDDPR